MIFPINCRVNAVIEKIALLQRLHGGRFSKSSSADFNFEILSPITARFFSIQVILIVRFENPAYTTLLKPFIFSIICITNHWL